MTGVCKFDKSWVGVCGNPTVDGSDYCPEHAETICVVCKEQATTDCDRQVISLMCGQPLCGGHKCRQIHGINHDLGWLKGEREYKVKKFTEEVENLDEKIHILELKLKELTE